MTATITPAEYVQRHLPMLQAYSRSNRFRPWFVDSEEFMQELVLNVLAKHHQFRNDGGSACKHCGGHGCSTWLGWRARRVASDLTRVHDRDQDTINHRVKIADQQDRDDTAAQVVPVAQGWGSTRTIEARSQVAQVLRVASASQLEACVSVLDDYDNKTAKAVLGISLHGRNYRLRGLAAALNN